MTKTKLSGGDEKPYSPVEPQPLNHSTTVILPAAEEVQQQADHSGATCWYVFGILATIFCCLPCGVIGMVHAMIAKHEGERGNYRGHRQRLSQAKCWISWSIALGFLIVVLVFTLMGISYYYGNEYYYEY